MVLPAFMPKMLQPETDETSLRRAVIETARTMHREGLSPCKSGNVSARFRNGMLITPTGMVYDRLEEGDIVFVGAEGETPAGSRLPSSEWHFHRAIYQAKPETAAIVHCHSLNATALACARKPIPAFHYMVAVAGGKDVPVAAYATFGTPELARAAIAALKNRRACLLANHGQIACGPDLESALDLAREIETLAAQYVTVLKLGSVHILDDAEMERVLAKFATYGQQPHGKSTALTKGMRRRKSAPDRH